MTSAAGAVTPAAALRAILERAEAAHWSGLDPYDGLHSTAGRAATPIGPFVRFALSQAALRVPLARTLIKPNPAVNPKGVALFLGAVVRGGDDGVLERRRVLALVERLVSELERRGVRAGDGIGWGYPFPWQSRYFWAPAGAPNAVVTATVGWQLLECADRGADARARDLGIAAARFLASGLHVVTAGAGAAALSYTPGDETRVVNISALASRLLLRAARVLPDARLADLADRLLLFVLRSQRRDGSWPYSLDGGGDWEDSFHTGYILESLLDIQAMSGAVPPECLTRGFAAYERFFGHQGEARLEPSYDSPLDAHSAAQGILAFSAVHASRAASATLRARGGTMARRIAEWSLKNLWLPARGHFAYRINRGRRDEREFIRWVEAWMAIAMAAACGLERAESATRREDEVGVA